MNNKAINCSLPTREIDLKEANVLLREYLETSRGEQFYVWQIFARIYTQKLWKQAGYENFTDYCFQVWGYGKTHAYNLVKAGEVINHLLKFIKLHPNIHINLPTSVKETVALAKIPESKRINAWISYQASKSSALLTAPTFKTREVQHQINLEKSIDLLLSSFCLQDIFTLIIPKLSREDIISLSEAMVEVINQDISEPISS